MKRMNLVVNMILLLSLLLALTACDTDLAAELQQDQAPAAGGDTVTEIDPVAIFTEAAATVNAQLTQTAMAWSPTPLPPTNTPLPQPTATLIQLNATATLDPAQPTFTPLGIAGASTLIPTATTAAIVNTPGGPVCDSMNYGDPVDINYADYTAVPAGTDFKKVWRIVNTGTCTWDDGYILVPVGSEVMAGSRTGDLNPLDAVNPAYKFKSSVGPGQSADVWANLSAPLTNGTYATHFVLQNDRGVYFGGVLTVIIKVTDGTD